MIPQNLPGDPVSFDAGTLVPTSPICFAEVVHYYLYCEQGLSNPFQQVWGSLAPRLVLPVAGGVPWDEQLCDCSCSSSQALTVFQRSLTTMQIQIQGLIQFALPLFPTAEVEAVGSPISSPLLRIPLS